MPERSLIVSLACILFVLTTSAAHAGGHGKGPEEGAPVESVRQPAIVLDGVSQALEDAAESELDQAERSPEPIVTSLTVALSSARGGEEVEASRRDEAEVTALSTALEDGGEAHDAVAERLCAPEVDAVAVALGSVKSSDEGGTVEVSRLSIPRVDATSLALDVPAAPADEGDVVERADEPVVDAVTLALSAKSKGDELEAFAWRNVRAVCDGVSAVVEEGSTRAAEAGDSEVVRRPVPLVDRVALAFDVPSKAAEEGTDSDIAERDGSVCIAGATMGESGGLHGR